MIIYIATQKGEKNMNTKYDAGYWVNQLTETDLEELFKYLYNKKKNFRYDRIFNIVNKKEIREIYYVARKQQFSSNPENKAVISDFKITSGLGYMTFFEYMLERFDGTDYADKLLKHIEKETTAKPDDTWSKRLIKVKEELPKILQNIEDKKKHQEDIASV